MSYRLLSTHTGDAHDILQWDGRSLEGELEAFEGRTLLDAFDRYLTPGSRVLEAGCGFGAWCEWLLRRGHDPVGVEYHGDIVAMSRELNAESRVELGDVTNLQFPADSFDAYVSLGVIEHLEDGPEPALSEAYRVLRPGGVAFITTPFLNPIRRYVSHPARSLYFALQVLRGRRSNFWEYRFTKEELAAFVRGAGFELLEVTMDDYDPMQSDRNIGLWADWFFLRNSKGIWELNRLGTIVHKVLRAVVPGRWYAAGVLVVARKDGSESDDLR